ncbi:MAG: NTP transferase domain-containing protein [Gemmataceae bacterium]
MMALIPAAGHSRRMGRPKLALPLAGGCILTAVIQTLKSAGVAEILVVIAPHVAELAPLARAAGAHVLELPAPTPDMRTTIEHGLAWLDERFHPSPDDAWLLVPADHPVLDVAAVRQLLDAFQNQSRWSLAVPTFGGKRGHPAAIAWRHVAGIRASPRDLGLNAYLRQHAAEMLEVPVDSDSILIDLDTPEDYQRLQSH